MTRQQSRYKMTRYLAFLLFPIFFACDDSETNNDNPYIDNLNFSFDINTNLPAYNQLTYAGNGVYVPGYGVGGVFVFFTGSGYTAFDAACPNQPITSCSIMYRDGIMAVCPCDEAEYSLYTGLAPEREYPLKPYRVQVTGANIRVFN